MTKQHLHFPFLQPVTLKQMLSCKFQHQRIILVSYGEINQKGALKSFNDVKGKKCITEDENMILHSRTWLPPSWLALHKNIDERFKSEWEESNSHHCLWMKIWFTNASGRRIRKLVSVPYWKSLIVCCTDVELPAQSMVSSSNSMEYVLSILSDFLFIFRS